MAKKVSYKEAAEELEEIINQLEANELEVDDMVQKVKRANELIKFCKEKLYKTTEEVNKILEG